MNSADWYARKLGSNRTPSPSTPASTPVTTHRPAPPPPQPQMQVTTENLAEAAGQWRGGQGTRTEVQTCPNCQSHLYFSRANGTSEAGGSGGRIVTQSGMATVAPRCFSCGHTSSMPMQTGSM